MDLKSWTGIHYTSLGLAVLGVAGQIVSLPNWHAATVPSFVGGTIAVFIGTLLGISAPKPTGGSDASSTK